MGLFKPAWMSKNEDKAIASVNAIDDQAELRAILFTRPHSTSQSYDLFCRVRIVAISKITDENLLCEFIKMDRDNLSLETSKKERRLKITALKRIKDQNLLLKLFLQSKPDIQEDIFSLLYDSNALLSIADYPGYEKRAVQKVSDMEVLYDFAKKTSRFRLALEAYRRLPFYDMSFDDRVFEMISPMSRQHNMSRMAEHKNYDPNILPQKSLEERRKLALDLAVEMEQDQRLANILWKHIEGYAREEVKTHSYEIESTHDEYLYESRGGGHRTIVSGGLGMNYPPNPFEK